MTTCVEFGLKKAPNTLSRYCDRYTIIEDFMSQFEIWYIHETQYASDSQERLK